MAPAGYYWVDGHVLPREVDVADVPSLAGRLAEGAQRRKRPEQCCFVSKNLTVSWLPAGPRDIKEN